ncbi:ubiquitin-fold modifier 1 isoform X1 [Xylocopa sonorina]|uniref:ubiquitin-fold modifier 1 isoform X1 n=1 Tax=Xylocopa sonorina TaxID=1818115 RepID=UPI00403ADEE7
MSELDFHEILRMFDTFIVLIENSNVHEETNVENVAKSFQCAQFIEITIDKAYEIGKERVLENNLHSHWLKEGRSNLYKCSELKHACDKLLEIYLKDSIISTDIVDEFLKLYVQYCGSERLNVFLKRILTNGVCMNIVIESLEKLGVPASNMQDDALIMSWEFLIGNGNEYEVLDYIYKMSNDGFNLKLVKIAVNLDNHSKIKQLIIQVLSNRLVKNDANVCLALVGIEKKSLWTLMRNKNMEFYTNFLDSIFYFARNMEYDPIKNHWISKYEFQYDHLVKLVETLLDGPEDISETIYNRVQLVKTHPNGTIWHKIENDIR